MLEDGYTNSVSPENIDKCPFCNSDRDSKTDEDMTEEMMKRAEANDPASICFCWVIIITMEMVVCTGSGKSNGTMLGQ